jgi:hypothetical protein
VKDQFSSVKFSQVSGWAHAREKAALARMPYGRKTAQRGISPPAERD